MHCSATEVVREPEVVLSALCCDLDFLIFARGLSQGCANSWWKVPTRGPVVVVLVARLRGIGRPRLPSY